MYWYYFILIINFFAYGIMVIDKVKSIYQWWRISERNLWVLAIIGGVFGIWLGMYWPMYHKAGKRNFQIGIPLIGTLWSIILLYFIK